LWETINQGTVAFLRGSKTIKKYLDVQNRVSLTSCKQALELLAKKRVDSAIMFASIATNLFEQYPQLKEKLTIQKPAFMSFHNYIYLNKKHIQLIPKLECSLKQLKESGFLPKLTQSSGPVFCMS
jgi:hypothetical protein